ncbi:MmpS family transport accessory protein [Streptomyces sp. LMG1-1-1.1]|uniref:MmpS family transport accessory protein n=1 Tax=Streptomyces sp. LMG1-1-1.1 TaxID=3135245 RepID=UPI003466BE05
MPTTEEPHRRIDRSGRGRRGVAVAAALLLVCGAFVAYGFRDTEDEDEAAAERAAPPTAGATYDVTYEVLGEGAADVSYRGAGGEEAHVTRVGLPWRKTVSVPLGASPIVNVTLGEKGGTASCTLAVRGKHVQRATATGAFGRTTCGGELPAPEAAAAPR